MLMFLDISSFLVVFVIFLASFAAFMVQLRPDDPAYGQFKALSLKAVQPFSEGVITDEKLTAISAKLAEIK